jgi:hypothetical protein
MSVNQTTTRLTGNYSLEEGKQRYESAKMGIGGISCDKDLTCLESLRMQICS